MYNKKCYAVSTADQLKRLIEIRDKKYKISIIFIKYYLVKGFGLEWLKLLIEFIRSQYKSHKIKFYVDAGYNHGLSLLLIYENIDYIKLKSNKIILKKINQIAKKNKVVLNPNINVVDLMNIKNIEKKLKI